MRRTLSDFFNDASRQGKKVVVGIAASFLFVTGIAPASPTDQPTSAAELKKIAAATFSQTTYWKHPEYNIIARIEPCTDKGLCMTVHNLDTESYNNKLLLAKLLGIGKPVNDQFSDFVTRYEPAPEEVQGWLVDRYCNYEAEVKLTPNSKDGSWSGSIHSPFNNKDYGISLQIKDKDTAIASGYFLGLDFLKKSIEVERVPGPVSACTEYSGESYWASSEKDPPKVAAAPAPKRK